MEKTDTKQRILEAALDLFSVQGFEATSIFQIAQVVGIRKASLYAHFASKQDILDTLKAEASLEFDRHSIFSGASWEDPAFTAGKESPEAICAMVKRQFQYVVHDPKISRVRKLLTIEQYINPALRQLYIKQSYEDILRFNTGLMRFLIRQGVLQEADPEIMAAHFAWPISAWIAMCDREPSREPEMLRLVDRHITQFFQVYGKKA